MTKYAIRGGGQVNLTQANFIAAGGEGQVFGHGDEAFKVYLKPERMIPEAKIAELAGIADESVVRPRRVLLDGKGNAVGYSMRRVADAHPLCQLFTRAFRDREGVDGATVLRIVQGMQRSMGAVHAAGVLVVDANEMNFLVAPDFGEVFFIDVDSYQTPHFPATALMEGVRDWSAGGHWTVGSDWYSWGIVTFQLFVGIHPYKGKHPIVRGLPERMRGNLSVFNRAVSVPQMVPPFDVIPGAYRAWYKAMFEDGFRGVPPADAQISTALGTARPVASATAVTLTLLRVAHTGDILEYVAWGGEEAAIISRSTGRVVWVLDGGRNREVPVEAGGHLAHTAAGVPLYAWLDRGDVHVRDLRQGGAEVALTLRGRALAITDGRVYVHSGESVVEIEFFEAGGKLLGAPRVVANVAPLATQLYPGVAMQSVLGAWYANLFPASGRSDQVRLADLDGARVVGARCEGPALIVAAERAGTVDRYVYEVGGSAAKLRWVDRNVGHGDLNFVALPKGVVAMIDEAGDLALFPARGTQQGKRISDPAVSDLRLAARGDEVVAWRGGNVFRLSTR
jgi:hypothetical protein